MSVKAKQAAKQKIAALSYNELLSKQESIQSRLSEIGIGEVNSNGISIVGGTSSTAANNNGIGGGGGGKRGRRRKRTTTPIASSATVPPPAVVGSNLGGDIPSSESTVTATANATSNNNNNDSTSSAVGESKSTLEEGLQNSNATKNHESSSIQNNDTSSEPTLQNINKDKDNNATSSNTTTTTNTIITPPSKIPFHPKTDIQWDFLLAEMKWLSADFQSERKRHTQLARKQSSSMKQFIKTKEKRQMQKLIQMELKRRKLSNKIARDVIKGWWDNKINRIIAYKQKVDAELIKKRSMDRHLIQLVKQTERYSDLLINSSKNEDGNGVNGCHSTTMTIEEALQQSDHETKMEESNTSTEDTNMDTNINDNIDEESHHPDTCMSSSATDIIPKNENGHSHHSQPLTIQTRKRRIKIIKSEESQYENDQNTTVVDQNNSHDNEQQQQQTQDDQEEFKPLHYNEIDDETTIEAEEKLGRDMSYQEEIDLLTKEGEMSVEELRAMYYGTQSAGDDDNDNVHDADDDIDIDENDNDLGENNNNHEMDETMEENISQSQNINDNMDCTSNTPSIQDSDEEAEKDIEQKKEEESEAEEFKPASLDMPIDDETTIEAEEKLGRDMSYEDEIALLNQENEMSIEELKAKYYGNGPSNDDNDVEEVEEEDDFNSQMEEDDEDIVSTEAVKISRSNISKTEISSDPFAVNDDAPEDEFKPQPDFALEVDDETTIEAEEKLGREMSYEDEIAMLKRESELSIEDLKRMYVGDVQDDHDQANGHGMDNESISNVEVSQSNIVKTEISSDPFAINDDAPEDEFKPQPDLALEVDDETTIEAEEKLGREMSYEDEIAMLKRESELSIEDLKRMYVGDVQDDHDQTNGHGMDNESISNVPNDGNEGTCEGNDDGNVSDATSIISNHGNEIEKEEEDFIPTNPNEIDDETTIEAEEKLGREMSYEEEIELLKRENEMSIEELRNMYLDGGMNRKRKATASPIKDEMDTKRMKQEDDDGEVSDKDEASEAIRSLEMADAKARNTAVSRPFILAPWVKLRAYQQIGLNWLVSTQTRRLNAILADEMGLGKTLQTISLLSYLACYKGIWGPHLIIVPTSCIVNWEMELKRFAPALKVLCYYGSAKRRKELRQGWTKTNWHHVIITSYQIVVQDSFAFKRKKWYYLILDEAHNIKNFQSQRWQTLINFNTQRRLLLTGTPLQNNLMELWSLLHFLMPYIFRSRKEFSQWFSNPMNNIIEGNTNRNDDLINRLHGIIRPFVLRRLKKDVETQMPGKFEHIVKCSLSRRQMFLYEEFMARSSTRMALEKGSNYMGMMNVLMQLRKVCNHPDLFEPRSIETPFFLESLSFTTAGCVANAASVQSPFDLVSTHLRTPLWSLGSGFPSVYSATKYNKTVAETIQRLMPSSQDLIDGFCDMKAFESNDDEKLSQGLQIFLAKILKGKKLEKEHSAHFQSSINTWRCQSQCFSYPVDTVEAVRIGTKIPSQSIDDLSHIRIASTPKELLQMKKSYEERENDLDEMMKKFVFYVPKARATTPEIYAKDFESKTSSSTLKSTISREYKPSIKPSSKLMLQDGNTPFFPDKKLVQFDAGKLQILSELLRSLKQGNHRVLIFTQMSKMLDILEVFLNLNGHTYLRLDGSTGVEQRQRLMDRFNNDEKMFCFILSTRSGGLGINLTGADTVVFYDSDWNPAMDAQAQDRAHRIGQTRDVHIYRLVTEHTIEENILVKAKQKRHLDFLVMDEGKFHASEEQKISEDKDDTISKSDCDIGTKSGLRNILGLSDESRANVPDGEMSKEELESAMATLEDEDDVLAMRGAQQEAAEELQEFDEAVKIKQETENDEECGSEKQDEDHKVDPSTPPVSSEVESEEAKLEKEFADWQRQVGADKASIDASLNPVERYALKFREEIEPFYSMWYMSSQLGEMEEANQDEVDLEEIESIKAQEEYFAIEDGDLLATLPTIPDLPQQRTLYYREKSRIQANKRRRKLTGENWSTQIDGRTKYPFWYNDDTGEAIWDKPKILVELDEYKLAERERWNALPAKPLVVIMNFLLSYPERMVCASVCRKWRAAAQDISFVHHVYPVEMGALSMNPKKMEKNHYRTITEAISTARAGDTIELGDGHYWLNDQNIVVDYPLRIIGDEKDPSHVVVEVSGTIQWKAPSGFIEGVTFRKPRINSRLDDIPNMLEVSGGLILTHSVVEGNFGNAVNGIQIRTKCLNGNGIVLKDNASLTMKESQISNHQGAGIIHVSDEVATININRCSITDNNGLGIVTNAKSQLVSESCTMMRNLGEAKDINK